MIPGTSDQLRYERKFEVPGLDVHQVELILRLHPAMFSSAHPPRWVNNIYLDTPALTAFHDHRDGVAWRAKVRIRWYGDLTGHVPRPALELKSRHGDVGAKWVLPMPPLSIDEGLAWAPLEAALRRTRLPAPIAEHLGPLRPTLVNRYFRRYYRSRDGRYRVTVDGDLAFHDVVPGCLRAERRPMPEAPAVLELKYAPDADADADRITQRWPFRAARSSKYLRGLGGRLDAA